MRTTMLPFSRSFSSEAEWTTWLSRHTSWVRRTTRRLPSGQPVRCPWIAPGSYVDPAAHLIGAVAIDERCFIGPNAVLRADELDEEAVLYVGPRSNVQDGAIVHAATEHIGSQVVVAHQAVVHGARVEDDVTLYIQAVVDGPDTVIGAGAFVHKGAYVGPGIHIPAGRLVPCHAAVTTRAQAEALPPVPAELCVLHERVLAHNAHHLQRHRAARTTTDA